MFVMLVAFLVAAFALLCIRVPSVWFALMAMDEPSDTNELGLVVASRNPFRESGPPACMAKLIMMRHKLNQANTRRRRTSPTIQRTAPRQFTLPAPRQRPAPWIRMPKHFGLQHH
ncbi:hypothetical protein B0F90DRAFT_1630765 [Multifurca ochricompacta]|uniref:Uncharacterized protein n=1 Tax=Multifurca ochricompacta TaxID=376703 RepID=A0AAD4M2U1_9AGAM|nr:hypothetical protein B0F90DRAFT_1630765 [Multifurca ochricompacta]